MLEEIAAPPYNGQADLPHLADSLQLEVDDLFPLGETCSCCSLAEFAEGDIKLTPVGKRFVDMDVDQRKKLFGEQLLADIPLAAHIKRVLDERPSHRAPATRFREELEDYMSEDYAERTLRAIINLGRYGELFAYDENAKTFSWRTRNSRRQAGPPRAPLLTCGLERDPVAVLRCTIMLWRRAPVGEG